MKRLLTVLLAIVFMLCTTTCVFGADNSNKCVVYLHFNNVMTNNGFQNFDYTPQKLDYGTSWSFTKKKLDNFISCKSHFEYNGDEYTYNGSWVYEDGSEVTFPVKIKPEVGQTEIHITVCPDYDIDVVKFLTVERVDPIRDTSASASNQNKVVSYTHTFEDPNDLGELENYAFLGWCNEEELVQPGESKTWVLNDFEDKYNTITYVAQYQPSLTVDWYVNDELVNSEKSFESVDSSYECKVKGFKGWVTEDGDEAEPTYYADEVNGEVKKVDLYASIEDEQEPAGGTQEPTKDDTADDTSEPEKKVTDKQSKKPVHFPIEKTDRLIPTLEETIVYADEKTVEEPATVETIDTVSVPLTSKSLNHWALLNLILMICTALLLLNITRERHRLISIIAAIVLTITSILTFVFTEDTFSKMIFIDKWTLLMIILFVVQLCVVWLLRKRTEEE